MLTWIAFAAAGPSPFPPLPIRHDLLLTMLPKVAVELRLPEGWIGTELGSRAADERQRSFAEDPAVQARQLAKLNPPQLAVLERLTRQKYGTVSLRWQDWGDAVGLDLAQRSDLARRYAGWLADSDRRAPRIPSIPPNRSATDLAARYLANIVVMYWSRERDRFDAETLARLTPIQGRRWHDLVGLRNLGAMGLPTLPPRPPFPAMDLLRDRNVQRELDLTPDAANRIVELIRRASLLQGASFADGSQKRTRMALVATRFLTVAQRRRLDQITVQAFGVKLFRNADFASRMGLGDDQVADFEALMGAVIRDEQVASFERSALKPPNRNPNSFETFLADREETARVMAARQERDRRLGVQAMKLLSSVQRSKYAELTGAPFAYVDKLDGLGNY